MHAALDSCPLFSQRLLSRSPPYILRKINFWYEMWGFYALFFSYSQREALLHLLVKVEHFKLHIQRVIGPYDATSSPYLSRKINCHVKHEWWRLHCAGKIQFRILFYSGSLLHDVIKRWRHVPPSVLRHSDNIDKSGNGSYVLCISLVWFRRIFEEIATSFRTFWSTHVCALWPWPYEYDLGPRSWYTLWLRKEACETLSRSNSAVRNYDPEKDFSYVCIVNLTLAI